MFTYNKRLRPKYGRYLLRFQIFRPLQNLQEVLNFNVEAVEDAKQFRTQSQHFLAARESHLSRGQEILALGTRLHSK